MYKYNNDNTDNYLLLFKPLEFLRNILHFINNLLREV